MIKKLMLMMAILLIFISGCEEGDLVMEDRYSGTQGIAFSFINDMPPGDAVYEETPFRIGLELHNQGANTATGYLSIGYDKAMINLTKMSITDLDSGETTKTKKNVENFILMGKGSKGKGYYGQKMRLFFDIDAKKITLSEKQDTQINFNLCYNTKTSLASPVCIDPDIYNEFQRKKVCTTQDLSFSAGQGAPISIAKIETRMIPEGDKVKPRFKIYMSNNQGGLIVDTSKIQEACTGDVVGDNYNKIGIKATFGGQALECLRVTDGKFDISKTNENAIECEASQQYDRTDSARSEELKIELEYGYTQSKIKTITIHNIE